MMIKPGISELMENIDSRYTLVMAVAKRARELAYDGVKPLTNTKSDKPVTIAAEEVAQGLIRIVDAPEVIESDEEITYVEYVEPTEEEIEAENNK